MTDDKKENNDREQDFTIYCEDNENTQRGRNDPEFISLLLSLYRKAPELWKVKSKQYYNKHKKALALTNITNALKVLDKGFNEEALKKKINSLRTNFNREHNKLKSSIQSGSEERYVPRLWYYDQMLFLKDSVQVADTENIDAENSSRVSIKIYVGDKQVAQITIS